MSASDGVRSLPGGDSVVIVSLFAPEFDCFITQLKVILFDRIINPDHRVRIVYREV